jgi:outer membrane receptor protein involved in Fe transport
VASRRTSHGLAISPWRTDQHTSDKAWYCNLNYSISKKLDFVGGLRYTYNSVTKNHADYRAGLVCRLMPGLVAKLLYGTSYRSPNYYELFSTSTPVIRGNRHLDPETMRGLDAGLYYSFQNTLSASLVYFWNKLSDPIYRVEGPDGMPTYENADKQEIHGLEYELKYSYRDTVTFFVNGTYTFDTKNHETHEHLDYIIRHMVNFGVTYKPWDCLTLSTATRYRDEWEESNSFFTTNIAVYYRPAVNKHIELFLTVNNLFDEDYTYAEVVRRNIDTIPGGPERSTTVGITIKY